MSYAQIRSTLIGAALACGLITVSISNAQVTEQVALRGAIGQAGDGPVLNPRHPESYVETVMRPQARAAPINVDRICA